MELSFAFLCDYADQSGGKISAIGIGFDTIYAPKVPAIHPIMFAVIGIRFSSVEVGQKNIGIRLIDVDGQDVIPHMDAVINVDRPNPGFLSRGIRMAVAMNGVAFPKYGEYVLTWLLGGQEIARAPIRIAEPPKPPMTA